jgi:hypothetical protein
MRRHFVLILSYGEVYGRGQVHSLRNATPPYRNRVGNVALEIEEDAAVARKRTGAAPLGVAATGLGPSEPPRADEEVTGAAPPELI